MGSLGHLTWVRHSSHKTSATHSCQCVPYFLASKQWYDCQCLGYLTYVQTLTHAIAHGGCTDTVRESAVEVDSGRKIPCRNGDSNPSQYCTWLFSRTLYQLNYPRPLTEGEWRETPSPPHIHTPHSHPSPPIAPEKRSAKASRFLIRRLIFRCRWNRQQSWDRHLKRRKPRRIAQCRGALHSVVRTRIGFTSGRNFLLETV